MMNDDADRCQPKTGDIFLLRVQLPSVLVPYSEETLFWVCCLIFKMMKTPNVRSLENRVPIRIA